MQTHRKQWHLLDQYSPPGEMFLWADLSRKITQNDWQGARGFRDFSRLPPAQENRGQPADPYPVLTFKRLSCTLARS